jgi:hypothetical protein
VAASGQPLMAATGQTRLSAHSMGVGVGAGLGPGKRGLRGSAGRWWPVSRPGTRWRVVEQLAAERDLPLVSAQLVLVGRARESEHFTRDKTDDKDAVLIARLVAELRCCVPRRPTRPGRVCGTSVLVVPG